MTQFNTLNVNLSTIQLNKLKSGIKIGIRVTLNLSSNVVDDSNDKTHFFNFPKQNNQEDFQLEFLDHY